MARGAGWHTVLGRLREMEVVVVVVVVPWSGPKVVVVEEDVEEREGWPGDAAGACAVLVLCRADRAGPVCAARLDGGDVEGGCLARASRKCWQVGLAGGLAVPGSVGGGAGSTQYRGRWLGARSGSPAEDGTNLWRKRYGSRPCTRGVGVSLRQVDRDEEKKSPMLGGSGKGRAKRLIGGRHWLVVTQDGAVVAVVSKNSVVGQRRERECVRFAIVHRQ
ncbi:uncharacterized protein B0I36DRAFT_314608 [Microdochium trichocladiopsis]|uniref:Uncharacterized protein n=1 Tax=Microdochium trichocladiopsis TaxID=1682393 RepID=A0A9P8YET9_9PEZI|nr:uncharacterized protein B0I36DRAFT_314608 [Microdochium trichocladiopsis]KAH7037686.1 hypothetical protein B0I36DRAFT_314608 [Microdochium trichocladiopsis]